MACRALIGHAMLGMAFKYDLSTLRLVKRWKERLQIPRDESERCAYGTRLQCCVAGACCPSAIPTLRCPWCMYILLVVGLPYHMISLGAVSMVRTLVGMSITAAILSTLRLGFLCGFGWKLIYSPTDDGVVVP